MDKRNAYCFKWTHRNKQMEQSTTGLLFTYAAYIFTADPGQLFGKVSECTSIELTGNPMKIKKS